MLLTRNSGRKGNHFLWVGQANVHKMCAIPFWHSGILLRISEQNGQQGKSSHAEGIVQVADDVQRRDGGQPGSNEHLCAVGDEALRQAREGIEYAGRLAAVQVEALGNVAGNGTGGDDGDGVVGRTEVGDAHQGGDAQFGSPFPADVAGEAGDDEVDAAVVAYQLEHASGQQGDDDELAHARDTRAHGAEPVEERHAGEETDEACRHDAQHQDEHDVDASHGGTQHDEVGQYLEPLNGFGLRRGGDAQPLVNVEAQYHDGGGHYDEAVHAELVCHDAVLRAGRSDGGVGNERQVVAEERAAYNDGCHVGQVDTGLFCQPHGYRRQGYNGAHTGTDGKRDEAGGQKDAGQQQVVRQDVEGQVDRRVNGAHLLGTLGKGAGQYEYPDHHQDVLVAGSGREVVDALFQLQAAGDGHGIARREQEGHGNGHLVEVVHQQ